jgi:hypothetical protein
MLHHTHENKKYDAIQIEASISGNCLCKCYIRIHRVWCDLDWSFDFG